MSRAMIVTVGWRVHSSDNLYGEAKDAIKHPTPKPQRSIQKSLSTELSLRSSGVESKVKLSSLAPSLQALATGSPLPLQSSASSLITQMDVP